MKPIPLEHNLKILELVGQNPHTTQADLAAHLGVAVGTVNWYLRRLIGKGYIKIQRLERRRLLYLITPRGIAQKSQLGLRYARASLKLYRETRHRAIELLNDVRIAGYDRIILQGDGDVAEICRLTCLDQRIQIIQPAPQEASPIPRGHPFPLDPRDSGGADAGRCDPKDRLVPIIKIDGMQIALTVPERQDTGTNSARDEVSA